MEARELGAVLAYLQREVPSLVALPPNELRSLVLQVSPTRRAPTTVAHELDVASNEPAFSLSLSFTLARIIHSLFETYDSFINHDVQLRVPLFKITADDANYSV